MPASGRQVQKPSPKVCGQQRVGIGADRVERDVAKVEQPGEADHDVQPPAQHDVGQHEGAEIDVVTRSAERQRNANDQQRRRHGTARSRASPANARFGRTVSAR